MANEGSSHFVEAVDLDGRRLEIYGTRYSDTPDGAFDHYDVFEHGECLNLGDPLYAIPSKAELRSFLAD